MVEPRYHADRGPARSPPGSEHPVIATEFPLGTDASILASRCSLSRSTACRADLEGRGWLVLPEGELSASCTWVSACSYFWPPGRVRPGRRWARRWHPPGSAERSAVS